MAPQECSHPMCHSFAIKRPARFASSRGFTLLELLIAILIVSILASLLVFTLSNSMEGSRRVKCLSNLRQIGTGILGYTGENDGKLPYGYWAGHSTWDQLVMPYMGLNPGAQSSDDAVFACPSDLKPKPVMGRERRSYSMVSTYLSGVGIAGVAGFSDNSGFSPEEYRIASLTAPSKTLLVTEFSANQAQDGTDNYVGGTACAVIFTPINQLSAGNSTHLHDGKFSYLFADGHVECLTPQNTIGDGTLSRPGGMWTRDPSDNK